MIAPLAARILEMMGSPSTDAIRALAAALSDSESTVRVAAASALAHIDWTLNHAVVAVNEVVDALLEVIAAPDIEVLHLALSTLGHIRAACRTSSAPACKSARWRPFVHSSC